jgi:hypothetical protein
VGFVLGTAAVDSRAHPTVSTAFSGDILLFQQAFDVHMEEDCLSLLLTSHPVQRYLFSKI